MEGDSNGVYQFGCECFHRFGVVEFGSYFLYRILCVGDIMSLFRCLYEVSYEGIYKGGPCL